MSGVLRRDSAVLVAGFQLEVADIEDQAGANVDLIGAEDVGVATGTEMPEHLAAQVLGRVHVRGVGTEQVVLAIPEVAEAVTVRRLGRVGRRESGTLTLERVLVESHAVVVRDLPTLEAPLP